jgi:uncharacterized membrane protein HdeD (DUF308 family)
MADKADDKRHWWNKARWQGLLIMIAGFGALASPVTAPYAGTVITLGAGWATGGAASAVSRLVADKKEKKPDG